MAAVVRAMTLGQNFHHLNHHHHDQMNNCVIVNSPETPPPSGAGSPPLMMNSPMPMHHTMLGKRTIAPAMHHHLQHHHHHPQQLQQHPKGNAGAPVVRFSGNDVKNICAPKPTTTLATTKRLNVQQIGQFPSGPMPSVERRNARERNRVKQVNNGFDKLRQYIPAKIVEVENGGRGASKKLSKVDTLKLAVKYIQRLKEMLDENNSRLPANEQSTSEPQPSMSSSSYYSPSPAPSSHHHQHAMKMSFASTPISNYQENPHMTTCSEPSVSPAPSHYSDVSHHTQQQPVYQNMQNAQYPKQYNEAAYDDEDSGSFEEDGILDDILQWQMQ